MRTEVDDQGAAAGPAGGATAGGSDREIVITRRIEAPRLRVFRAFTDPDQVTQWWGPTGFTTTTEAMEVRPGGEWRFTMHGPDGTDYPNRIRYREVTEPERLRWEQDGGEGSPASERFETTVTFAEADGGTVVTLRSLFASTAARDHVVREYGAIEGGRQTLGRLAAYLGAS